MSDEANVALQERVRCMRAYATEMNHAMKVAAGLDSGCCDPQPEKAPVEDPTLDQQACLLLARIRYLNRLLDCEGSLSPVQCADQAYHDYCEAVESCVE